MKRTSDVPCRGSSNFTLVLPSCGVTRVGWTERRQLARRFQLLVLGRAWAAAASPSSSRIRTSCYVPGPRDSESSASGAAVSRREPTRSAPRARASPNRDSWRPAPPPTARHGSPWHGCPVRCERRPIAFRRAAARPDFARPRDRRSSFRACGTRSTPAYRCRWLRDRGSRRSRVDPRTRTPTSPRPSGSPCGVRARSRWRGMIAAV